MLATGWKISNGGRTYTYHLKPGVMWDTTPARQVTATDEVRGIELLCNPASPTGAPGYYESTIVGMTAWCKAFLKVKPTVPAIKAFHAGHHLAGVQAKGALTVVFHLTQAASDFNNIVSLPFASPQPVEALSYVPDSADFRSHTFADGPYRITTYRPNNQIVLTRNPAWKASTAARFGAVNATWVSRRAPTSVAAPIQNDGNWSPYPMAPSWTITRR